MDEEEPSGEKVTGAKPTTHYRMSLQEAVDMGEYHPEFLAQFAQWHTLTVYMQFQLIRKALDNRHRQIITQYAELNNVLDLREKPHVQKAIKQVEKQLKIFEQEREGLFVRYTNILENEQ